MSIGPNTKFYGSISEFPGSFGKKFHNAGYDHLGLDMFYLPLKISPAELKGAVSMVKNNMAGCGVSMPYKFSVMEFLDSFDQSALNCGAVNTITNVNGVLKGYNADYYGAKKALETLDVSGKSVLMIGAGGVAHAIAQAVCELGGDLMVANRTESKAEGLVKKIGGRQISLSEVAGSSGYLLINATSLGMHNRNESVVEDNIIGNFDNVLEVVVTKGNQSDSTRLVRESLARGKNVIKGLTLTTYQAAEQFRLYTGQVLSESFLNNFVSRWERSLV